MLKEIYIENYKSLKNTKVEFKDGLNIIIGKNGSGKSNLLEFIKLVISISPFLPNNGTGKYSEYSFHYKFYYNENGVEIILSVEITHENIISNSGMNSVLNITINKVGKAENNILSNKKYSINNNKINLDINAVAVELSSIKTLHTELIRYGLHSKLLWLDKPLEYSIKKNKISINGIEVNDSSYYTVDGSYNSSFSFRLRYAFERKINSSNFIYNDENILNQTKDALLKSFEEYNRDYNITDNLKKFSTIEEIRINPNVNIYKIEDQILLENLTMEFRVNNSWIPWSHLSDGAKRLFYIIVEILTYVDSIILIEEPELGIHPHQLYKLMQFIKEQSEEKQIIISTHSPLILDSLEPDELDRITIAKIENGSSQFHKLTNEQMEKAKVYMHEQMDLSFYWLHSDLESE